MTEMRQCLSVDLDLADRIATRVHGFVAWLDQYGERSLDHQSFYAGGIGGGAKRLYYKHRLVGTVAVAPMVFCESFMPSARRLFAGFTRFPIADAHYAMGFAYLSTVVGDHHHRRAVSFLEALVGSRSPDFERYCWGYPFDWVTQGGTIKRDTPFVTSTPYVYEAFRSVYDLDRDERWLRVTQSIAEHVLIDIPEFPTSGKGWSCGYSPDDQIGGVVNAAAYRAWLLAAASVDCGDERYWEVGKRNLDFVLESQRPDGSWYYSVDGSRNFVDHFHTCFVLKALAKIDTAIGSPDCQRAIDTGARFYQDCLLDGEGLPKPFAKAPRLTVYKRELYDYAECVNLCLLLRDRLGEFNQTLERVIQDLDQRWVKPDGSFRSRELLLGWDNVPMHRWAQSQMFRSLALLLRQERSRAETPDEPTQDDVRNLRAV